MKQHDRIGVRQVVAQFGFVDGLSHDKFGDVAQDGRLDRDLIQKVGDQHGETHGHRHLLARRTDECG